MKVAISCRGKSSDALVDSRFGRCAAFAIYDTDDASVTFIDNPNINSGHGAGPASVSLVANMGVQKIVSGEFGFKVKDMLNDLKIQMVIMKEEHTVEEIINLLK